MKELSKIANHVLRHPLLKGSAIVFCGSMMNNVLAYAYHLVVGRILGPSQYGELAALISIFYILNAPAGVLQNVLVKFFSSLKAKNELGQARQLYMMISKYCMVVLIVFFIALLPFVQLITRFLNVSNTSYIVWLYIIFAFFVFGVINTSVLQAFQKFSQMTVITNLGAVVRLISGALGAFFGVGWTLVANVVSNIIGYGIAFFPLTFLLGQKPKRIELTTKDAVLYSIPALIAITAITAIYSQDVILVKHFFSPQDAGLYSSLSVLGKIVFFASSAVGIVAFPVLAERKELGQKYGKIIGISLLSVGIISFGLTAVYYLFPVFVVGMLFGKAFEAASPLLGGFGLFISFFSLSYLLTMMYLALGKTKVWIIVLLGALVQIALIMSQHTTLAKVIDNNVMVSASLFVLLLLYYPYAKRQT